jgi:UDP:flavonoid glycosyltransferase YjiC (YdhE family)
VSARTVRLAVVRALADPSITARARELAVWASENDAAQRAAELVEAFAVPSGGHENIRSWTGDGLSDD